MPPIDFESPRRWIARHLRERTHLDPYCLHPTPIEIVALYIGGFFLRWLRLDTLSRLFALAMRLRHERQALRCLVKGNERLTALGSTHLEESRLSFSARLWFMTTLGWGLDSEIKTFLAQTSLPTSICLDLAASEQVLLRLVGGSPRNLGQEVFLSAPPGALVSQPIPTHLRATIDAFASDRTLVYLPNHLLPRLHGISYVQVLSMHTVGRYPNLLHFKESDLPPYLILDPEGFSGWVDSRKHTKLGGFDSKDCRASLQFCEDFVNFYAEKNLSKYWQPPSGQTFGSKPFVFVALQTPTDLTRRKWLLRPSLFIVALLFWASRRGYRVVVKPHPHGVSVSLRLLLELLRGAGLLDCRQDSIHELIPKAHAVFTANSGVGSEALMYLRPVYLFGKSEYAHAAHTLSSIREVLAIDSLARPVSKCELASLMRSFREEYLVRYDSRSKLRQEIKNRIEAS